MPTSASSLPLRWRARLVPDALGHGWMPVYTLGYLTFLFVPVLLAWLGDAGTWSGGASRTWPGPVSRMLWPTLLSIVVFLPLYFAGYRTTGTRALLCVLGIAGVGCALMPFNAFANAYTIYAVGFAAMLGGPLWRRLAWTGLLLAVLTLQVVLLRYPLFIVMITSIVAVSVFFGNHHFVESNRKRAALKLSHEEVRRLATMAERERIGRDLHDLLGHTLSLVALKSELAGKLLLRGDSAQSREAAHREIVEVGRVARDALAQVRSAVTGIRAAGLAAELVSARLLLDTDGIELVATLAPGCLDGDALPAAVESTLALTVREAVTNIQRHARAQRAEVSLDIADGHAVLRIRDDGRGARDGALVPGNGLAGMRERIQALGGQLHIHARKGEGTRLEAVIPLPVRGDGAASLARAAMEARA